MIVGFFPHPQHDQDASGKLKCDPRLLAAPLILTEANQSILGPVHLLCQVVFSCICERVLNFTQKQMLAYWYWPFSGSNQICVSSLESKRAWIATYLIIFKLYYTTMWKINERQRWRNRMMFLMCDQTSLRWGIHINL